MCTMWYGVAPQNCFLVLAVPCGMLLTDDTQIDVWQCQNLCIICSTAALAEVWLQIAKQCLAKLKMGVTS